MRTRLRRAVLPALAVLALLAQAPLAYRSVRILREETRGGTATPAERRIEPIRTMLQGVHRAGYLTDLPPDSIGTDAIVTEQYFLTQYFLAPVVLHPGTAESVIVGTFMSGTIPARYSHLTVLARLDSGLYLMRGTGE